MLKCTGKKKKVDDAASPKCTAWLDCFLQLMPFIKVKEEQQPA